MTVVDIESITLDSGGHSNYEDGVCLLEAVSFIAGEEFSDHPKCVSPVLGAYGRRLNDRLGNDDRQKLKAYISRLIGTNDPELEEARSALASDWVIRTVLPRWLDVAGAAKRADQLRALDEIRTYAQVEQHRALVRVIRDEMWEARRTARQKLQDKVAAELQKRGLAVADAAAVAVADAVAAADADAVADAVADAAADAVADADADAVAVAAAAAAAAAAAVAAAAAAAVAAADAAADAVAAAAAAADAVAVAVAVAVAAADAAAAPSSKRWGAVYYAVRKELDGKVRAAVSTGDWAEAARVTNEEAIALLGRMIEVKA